MLNAYRRGEDLCKGIRSRCEHDRDDIENA